MPEETVATTEVIYKDVFHLKTLYILMHDWLEEEDYYDEEGGHTYMEKFYHERVIQNVGKEIRIWWRTLHYPGNNPYLRYKLNIDFLVLAMKDVEIAKGGQKVRANHGEVGIKIRGILETDYKKQWENGILKGLLDRFNRYFYKKELWYHREFLLGKIQALEQEIKTHLQMKHFLKEKEPFAPRFKE